MVSSKSFGERLFDSVNYFLLVLLMIVTVYPFMYVFFGSLSDPAGLMAHQGLLLKPVGFDLISYRKVFENPMILVGYRNTLVYLFSGTAVNMLLTILGAYVLSRKSFYIRDVMMFAIVFTMFFGGGLIPFYILIMNLNMRDTLWALILPGAVNTMNLIVMRTSFQSIPDSMEESAKIDGANDFTVLSRIIVPLSIPTIAVMLLFYGVHHWNAWFNAMIFLRKRTLYPLQLVLREILITNSTDDMVAGAAQNDKYNLAESIKYATIMVATVPILLVYPFLQRYFVKGVMIGAIKE